MPKDYYAVLGLSRGADDVVVHAAWKALLRKYHPDTNTDASAEARARDINEAFAVLGKPGSRASYDRARSAPPPPPRPGPNYRQPPPRPAQKARAKPASRRRVARAVLALAMIPAAILAINQYPDALPDLRDRLSGYGDFRPSSASFAPAAFDTTAFDTAFLASPAAPPPIDPARIAAAVRRADRVFHKGGIAAAAAVSRACDTAAISWPALDDCTAFDIAVSLADVTTQGSLRPPDPYFVLTAQRDALRAEQLDGNGTRAAARLEAIHAQVVPLIMNLVVRRDGRSPKAAPGRAIDRRPVAALDLR